MIEVVDVHKRYRSRHGYRWVLKGVSFTIPKQASVGLIGANGAGKSTLLRIIGGMDQPTLGEVRRRCRVSWPVGLAGGFQGSMSCRQNVRFVCRIHGHDDDIEDRVRFVEEFSELGSCFDEPVRTLSSGQRARLGFALSLAFDFDAYLVDEITAVGDSAFRDKAVAAFEGLANRASLIMVAHGESTLRQFCTAGICLENGAATWFDRIDDALAHYHQGLKRRA